MNLKFLHYFSTLFILSAVQVTSFATELTNETNEPQILLDVSRAAISTGTVPSFPFGAWVNFLQNNDYGLPALLGFTPQRERVTGIVKTSPLALNADNYKVVPVVVRCNRPSGCANYHISAMVSSFGFTSGSTELGYVEAPSNQKPPYPSVHTPINSVFIPADDNGNPPGFINVRANYRDKNYLFSVYPRDYSDKLKTNYGSVIAVIYFDLDWFLEHSDTIITAGYQTSNPVFPSKNKFTFPTPLITGTPFITNGYVWKLIETNAAVGAGDNVSKQFSVQRGISDSQTVSNAIQIGFKVSDSHITPADLSAHYTRSWSRTFTSSQSSSVSSSTTCSNQSGPAGSYKICGIYQLYGTTILNVPGISDRDLFGQFNDSPSSEFFTLSVGMGELSSITDDTNLQLGVLYPVAGTLTAPDSLNLAQPALVVSP